MYEQQIEELKVKLLLEPLQSAEEMQNWFYNFFDIFMPIGHVYEDSNSSAIGAMWEIYCAVRDNTGNKVPGYTLLSSRDSYKTLSASMLAVLLMLHFRTTVAYCAAIESQSQKSIKYCQSFMLKVTPYLKANGWKQISSNKRTIELVTDKGEECYLQLIILTLKGANSAHVNLLLVDEVDLCDPTAYQEAKMIPGVCKGRFPLTIRLSTRKFAFGLMEKAIKEAPMLNERVLRWNILDVAEYCPEERCRPKEPTALRYIPNELPLRQISADEYALLNDKEKINWTPIEAYAGCVGCDLLSSCKKILHDKKPKHCVGDLYKPIDAIINVIKGVDPDVGEAQLLCHKPSTKGVIYSRFKESLNVLSVQQAWEKISGLDTSCDFPMLVEYIKNLGIKIEAGLDWGFTNMFAIVVAAFMPDGISFILHTFAAQGFELDDSVKVALELKEKFGIERWWADQAYPANIKTFNRKGLKSPKFKKDVPEGIEAIRLQIVNSANVRKLFVIDTVDNRQLIDGFSTYHWKLDAQGNPTESPDHSSESDIMDAIRYLFQNVYKKAKILFSKTGGTKGSESSDNSERIRAKIKELAPNSPTDVNPKAKKKIFWG